MGLGCCHWLVTHLLIGVRLRFSAGAVRMCSWCKLGCRRAQVYPKLFMNGSSMYETTWWGWLVTVWEAIVYNPLIDLGACYQASHRRPRARPVWH